MNFNYWGWQTAFVTIVLAIFGSFYLKRYSKILALNFAWAAFSMIHIFAWPDSMYRGNGAAIMASFDLASARGLAELLAITFAAISIGKKGQWWTLRAFAAVNAIAMVAGSFFHMPYGFLINASMSGCFAACMIPILPRFEAFLSLVAAILAFRHMPFACLGAMGLALTFRSKYWKVGLLTLPFAPLMVAKFFDANGRTETWDTAWKFFENNGHWPFGYGGGSFNVLGPYLTKHTGALWFWMHNDYLQILFEQGVLGAVLITALLFQLLRKSWNTPMFYSLIGAATWATANMPLRYPLGALFCACITRWVFEAEETQILLASRKRHPNFQGLRQKFAHLFDRSSEEYRPESEQVSTRS